MNSQQVIYQRHAIKELAESFPNEMCLIYSKQHGAYWRENRAGYTLTPDDAGEYEISDAYEIVCACGSEKGLGIVRMQTGMESLIGKGFDSPEAIEEAIVQLHEGCDSVNTYKHTHADLFIVFIDNVQYFIRAEYNIDDDKYYITETTKR